MRTSITLGLGLPLVAALAAVVAFWSGSLSSRAVQAPVMSLDMDPAGGRAEAAALRPAAVPRTRRLLVFVSKLLCQ